MLSKVGLSVLGPQAADTSFEDWWIKIDKLAPTVFRKGINSLIILGAWMIWKQRNDCVFNGGVAKRAENPNTHRRGSAFVVFSWSKGAYTPPCSKRLGPSPLLVVGRVLF